MRESEEFFVGYLPIPPKLRRSLWLTIALIPAALLAVGATAATFREAPAASMLAEVTLIGRLEARGYGVLWTASSDGKQSAVLLARGGKFGAADLASKHDGKVVSLRGLLLEREGTRMLEIQELDDHPSGGEGAREALRTIDLDKRGARTLRGEIVDIKCWLGRMKPGDGRTHRACAQFCIAGGMPPVLAATDGQRYVLTDLAGRPINEAVLPFVAEAVELRGDLEVGGGLNFLRVDPRLIHRL
ncbi:MAG TPA: hypothetical protein VI299_24405 [Polyangiales bacterium]